MRICFGLEEFKDWLEKIGCDDCQYFPELEGSDIVHKWEFIKVEYGTTIEHIKHRDLELRGEILGAIEDRFKEKWNNIIGKDEESVL